MHLTVHLEENDLVFLLIKWVIAPINWRTMAILKSMLCLLVHAEKNDSLMVKKTKLFTLHKFGSLLGSTSTSLKIG